VPGEKGAQGWQTKKGDGKVNMDREAKYCSCGALMEYRLGNSKEKVWKCLFCNRLLLYAKNVNSYRWFTFESQERRGK